MAKNIDFPVTCTVDGSHPRVRSAHSHLLAIHEAFAISEEIELYWSLCQVRFPHSLVFTNTRPVHWIIYAMFIDRAMYTDWTQLVLKSLAGTCV